MTNTVLLLLKIQHLSFFLVFFAKKHGYAKTIYALIACEVAISITLDIAFAGNKSLIFKIICV